MSARRTNDIRLLIRDAANLPAATSLYTYWREQPINKAAFENDRYSALWISISGVAALRKSRWRTFRCCFAFAAHSSQQYRCVPQFGTNSAPQNAQIFILFIITTSFRLTKFSVHFHRDRTLCLPHTNSLLPRVLPSTTIVTHRQLRPQSNTRQRNP